MKPYSLSPDKRDDIGCCPGHDWPRTRKYAGTYSSPASKRTSSRSNKIAKRTRRRLDKVKLRTENE